MAVVAVTGASGFVGGHLVTALARRGHQPVGIARSGVATSLRIVGDIDAHTRWSEALRGVEVVVHCAARAHVTREDAADPMAVYRTVNVDGTRHLAEQAASNGVRRLVFLSSVKAVAERSAIGRPLTVIDAPRPEDAYGRSKHEAELALLEISARSGLETVIVRPPLVYGPGVKGNFLRLLGAVAHGLPLPLGAIDNARSMVSVANLVDFLSVCIEAPAAAGGRFFVSDGVDLSTTSLVRKMGEAMGRRARLLPVPARVLGLLGRSTGRSAEVERLLGTLQVDIGPCRDVLGWLPPNSVDDGLLVTAQWFRNRR